MKSDKAAKAAQPEEVSIVIQTREEKPYEAQIFNQFRLLREPAINHLFLGLNLGGTNVNSILLSVPDFSIDANREAVLKYYDTMVSAYQDLAPEKESSFTGITQKVYHGNVLDFSRFGELACIRLSYFSIRQMVTGQPYQPLARSCAT